MCMLIFKSQKIFKDKTNLQTSSVAQWLWLRLWASSAGGVGSIPDRGSKFSHAVQCGQKVKKKKISKTLAIFFLLLLLEYSCNSCSLK